MNTFAGWLIVACGAGCARDVEPHGSARSHGKASSAKAEIPSSVGERSKFSVLIRQPPLPQGVPTNRLDSQGKPVHLQCAACHTARPAKLKTAQGADLNDFHQGLKMAHGSLTCVSCHQASDGYATLRHADGQSIRFEDSMTLCAQCHGTQFRDYQHGSHGGMTGHWDLRRGNRTRNHCLHCHDPHAPKFPVFSPAPGPRDRFQPVSSGASHD